jgi:hypothetical protein
MCLFEVSVKYLSIAWFEASTALMLGSCYAE